MDYPDLSCKASKLYRKKGDTDGHQYRFLRETKTHVWLAINKLSADMFRVTRQEFGDEFEEVPHENSRTRLTSLARKRILR